MKKILFIVVAICLMVAPVYADWLPVGAFDNSDADIAIPGRSGYRTCVTAFKYDATNATDDIKFYVKVGGLGNETVLSADEAAAQTAISTEYEDGIATDAVVIYERADGTYADIKTLSGNATTGVLTSAAIDRAFKKGDKVYETQVLFEYADVGTDATEITSSGSGLFCGPVGSGIGAVIDNNLMIYMSGFYAK